MEICELVALLETKIKSKIDEFEKVDREQGVAKSRLFNDLKSLQTTMMKLTQFYPMAKDYFIETQVIDKKDNDGK